MSGQPRRLLGDIIAEKQAQQQSSSTCKDCLPKKFAIVVSFSAANDLDPRIASMYEQVGQILASYRSGKIPKAFKILPNLSNWEQVDMKIDDRTFRTRNSFSGSTDHTTRSMDCRIDVSSHTIIRFEYGCTNGSAVRSISNS